MRYELKLSEYASTKEAFASIPKEAEELSLKTNNFRAETAGELA